MTTTPRRAPSSVDPLARPREASVHDRVDVERLLREPLLRGAYVLAGKAALERDVAWCLPWDEVAASGAELDGAAVVIDSAQLQAAGTAALRGLHDRGASAVFVAAGTPGLDLAPDEGALPVVVLPAGVRFGQLNRLIAELALEKEAHVLRYGLTVHQALAELLYRGSGLGSLARQLSRLTSCPVAILDAHGRRLAFETEGDDSAVTTPSAEDVVRAVVSAGGLDVIAEPAVHPPRTMEVGAAPSEGPSRTCLVRPIVLGGRHDGWIVLVEDPSESSWHERARHEVVLEQATMIVGSEMLRLRSVETAEERARGDFVHALLHGRLSNPQELHARAVYYDFDVTGRYGAIVARQVGMAGNTQSQQKMQQLLRAAARLLTNEGYPPLVTVVGDMLGIVLQTQSNSLGHASAQVAELARSLHRDLTRIDPRPLTVTYGRPMSGATKIVDSYREARVALGVCERLLLPNVSGYGELRVFGAILELASSQRGQLFAREVLEPLRKAGKRTGGDLEDAVVTYVKCGGNLNASARQMSLHRNTMLYKLDRASRALGMDLRSAEDRFTFWLAYRIDMLGDVQAQVGRDLAPRT